MNATVLDMPSAWPDAMNQTIEATIDGTTTGTEAERERSEWTLRNAITAYLETHDEFELQDLTDEYTV